MGLRSAGEGCLARPRSSEAGRFVQEPQGPMRHEQPCQRDPAGVGLPTDRPPADRPRGRARFPRGLPQERARGLAQQLLRECEVLTRPSGHSSGRPDGRRNGASRQASRSSGILDRLIVPQRASGGRRGLPAGRIFPRRSGPAPSAPRRGDEREETPSKMRRLAPLAGQIFDALDATRRRPLP